MTLSLSKLGLGVCLLLASIGNCLAQRSQTFSIAVEYTYLRTNLLPGCSCFSLNGGSVQVLDALSNHVSVLGDLTVAHKGNVGPDGYALTQLSYTFGAQYLITAPKQRLRPFGQVKLGGVHASGSLAPTQTGLGSSNAFALETGGGLQIGLGRHMSLLPVEANYLLTTFGNGASGRQNDLKLSAGLLYRFGHSSK